MSTNDPQQQMIRDAMQAIAQRKPGKTKLVYNKAKRTIEAVAEGAQAAQALNITAEDADMFAVITLSSAWMRAHWHQVVSNGSVSCEFSVWDDGDALTQCELGPQSSPVTVEGVVSLEGRMPTSDGNALNVVLKPIKSTGDDSSEFVEPSGSAYRATVTRTMNGANELITAIFADVQPELATRRSGILESMILADTSVLCIGLGTGGAHIALELAKCGVGSFGLVDRDRLKVGNVVRHPGGISQVGRLKVNVVRDLIKEKNPEAVVFTAPFDLTFANKEELRQLVAEADVVICGTDNRTSKLLVNQLCVEENVPAIYGGAFRRAYGGRVLRVRPKTSLCYQCLVAAMPEEEANVEVSSTSDAADIAYSDQPVAVEPGLSLDVLPIANMVAKLALSELLLDKATTLRVLSRDYDAPWYLWLNRPEAGTPYAAWPPLSESTDEMTINRWYGIYIDRDADCPACGDFITTLAAGYGLDLSNLGMLPEAPPDLPLAAPAKD